MTSSVEFSAVDPVPDPTHSTDRPVVPPTEPREYHQALRRPGIRPWRGVVALVIMIVGYLLVGAGLGLAGAMIDVARGASSMQDMQTGAVTITPVTLLAVNLNAAAMIPLGVLVQRWLFGVRGGFLSSVRGVFRWRLLRRVALVVVPVWIAYVAISVSIGMPGQPSMEAFNLSIAMLAVVLTTTWAQSAGEEYLFRGMITRSIGMWFSNPRVAFVAAALVANLLFMIAHLASDPWLIAYYFVFGVSCSVIVWRTGGLEASSLIHAVNNIVFFLVTLAFSGDTMTLDRSVGSGGPFMLVPMGMMILAAAGISLWARRTRPARLTEPGIEVSESNSGL